MILVEFEKSRMQHFLGSLDRGLNLSPQPEGWTQMDLLLLAGACLDEAAARHKQLLVEEGEINLAGSKEQQEAGDLKIHRDIEAAIRFCASRASEILSEEFDRTFEPRFKDLVDADDTDGTYKHHPLEGDYKFTPLEGVKL